jgi:putative chitinase
VIDRETFFALARDDLFDGVITAAQIKGCTAILDAWEERPAFTDLRWLAYILATVRWETSHTMTPREEAGKGQGRPHAAAVGRRSYYGRGFVPLTWATNYARMTPLTGVDLMANPELALDHKVAAIILLEAMKSGLFTGASLPMYFNRYRDDPFNARRVIKGIEDAEEVAEIHNGFLKALSSSKADTEMPQASCS